MLVLAIYSFIIYISMVHARAMVCIAIAIALIWYVHIPRSVLEVRARTMVCSEVCLVSYISKNVIRA